MPPVARVKYLEQLSSNKNLGIYIHVPFCLSKCGYCDFYSFKPETAMLSAYKQRIIEELLRQGEMLSRPADTLYLGGGTPSLLGTKFINEIVAAAKKSFSGIKDITLEMNPKDELDFSNLDITRLSLGMQSVNDNELLYLGRRHRQSDLITTLNTAKKYIKDISLDVMLGIPYQTEESLKNTLNFAVNSGATHISAYMLKKEKNTPFFTSTLPFPNEDEVCDMYLLTCNHLKTAGFNRYEISNFAKSGYESRHNLKYWLGADYLGLGPAAHSRIDGNRFYYKKDYNAFMNGEPPVFEGNAGSEEENIMLSLRTSFGYNFNNDEKIKKAAIPLSNAGLINYNNGVITLTDKGALLENTIIAKLIEAKK